ncbi:hypothetical protein VTK26DRAFT_3415 [Humicola hyalothermophila]
MGCANYHAWLTFDDGERWLARIPRTGFSDVAAGPGRVPRRQRVRDAQVPRDHERSGPEGVWVRPRLGPGQPRRGSATCSSSPCQAGRTTRGPPRRNRPVASSGRSRHYGRAQQASPPPIRLPDLAAAAGRRRQDRGRQHGEQPVPPPRPYGPVRHARRVFWPRRGRVPRPHRRRAAAPPLPHGRHPSFTRLVQSHAGKLCGGENKRRRRR